MRRRCLADRISKARRSWNMSRIKSTNTSLELRVRRYLHSRGIRYRIGFSLEGKPDIVFPGKRIAVFVNGCFWHAHGCSLSHIPSTRTEYWGPKLRRNRERDREVRAILSSTGWRVLAIWECDIRKDIGSALAPLFAELLDRTG